MAVWIAFVLTLSLVVELAAALAEPTCTAAREQPLAEEARALFLRWVNVSSVPGAYTTAAQRAAASEHPGDLTHTRIFHDGPFGATAGGRPWPHTKPNPIFEDASARERMLEAVAWLLRRGMSRLQDAVLPLLGDVATAQVEQLLALARRALVSFEDFWLSVRWTVAYGPRQVDWHVEEEMKEYGPETNFWLKFRPLLSCHHAPRIGPELGGAKAWCNPHAWPSPPRHILSAGAGDDMLYETIAARLWPGVTIVTPDCFQYSAPATVAPAEWNGSRVLFLPLCLTGEDRAYAGLAPPHLRERFVTYPQMLRELRERHGVEGFDFIKCNIEASEYPLFAHIMRDVDANLRGTAQINIEMHRMGMHDYKEIPPAGGRDFNSLLFMQLLWATFLSGGFHPVFVEKWHDKNAAEDVVWVNQTWWLLGELEAVRSIWTREWPDVPLSGNAYPDAATLARQHAAGVDPYRAPSAARAVAKHQAAGGAPEKADGGAGSGVVRALDAVGLRELRAAGAPALLKIDPPACAQCAELEPIWQAIAENFESVAGYPVPVYRLSCAQHRGVCEELREGADPVAGAGQPAFGVWTGSRLERYRGKKQGEALVAWLGHAVRSAQLKGAFRPAGPRADADAASLPPAEEPPPPPGGDADGLAPTPRGSWAQLPVEVVEELSVGVFLARYVEPQLPVILRRRTGATAAPDVGVAWLRRECASGRIHVFERDPASVGWGGFGEPQQTSLGEYLDRVSGGGTEHYGFDLKAACDCAALLDRVELLAYFRADQLPFDAQMPHTNWPALIAGPAGSRSALHVDSGFLPFWLTLLGGRKTFRVVTLEQWRRHFARASAAGPPLYAAASGAALFPVDAFDDGFAERELLGRGAAVWNGTLEVGDAIYIPTGALHGAFNEEAAGAAIALSSNFLDAAHAGQVDALFCAQLATAHVRAAHPICARLAQRPRYDERESPSGWAARMDAAAAVASADPLHEPRAGAFWSWLLGRPQWCARYAPLPGERACAGARVRCPLGSGVKHEGL